MDSAENETVDLDEAEEQTRATSLGKVLALVGTVLGWIRKLVFVAVVLALVDVGLFLLPRRDESAFVLGALVLAVVFLLPAVALDLLGKRFVAFRDGIVTIGQKLPEMTSLPRSLFDDFADLAPMAEATERKGRFGRLTGSARMLGRVTTLVRAITERHKELFSASTTVVSYGPRDALLALYGVLGLCGLAFAVPVLAIWAVLAS